MVIARLSKLKKGLPKHVTKLNAKPVCIMQHQRVLQTLSGTVSAARNAPVPARNAHQKALRLADDVGKALPLAVRPAHQPDIAAHPLQHAQPQVQLLGGILQSSNKVHLSMSRQIAHSLPACSGLGAASWQHPAGPQADMIRRFPLRLASSADEGVGACRCTECLVQT